MLPPASDLRERDLRIDFFRGLALYIILVDHIAFNPIGNYTYHRFGFSDGAEIFVFVSGLACGIAYHSTLTQQGAAGLIAAVIKRASLIYVFYVLSSLATICLITASADAILHSHRIDRALAEIASDPFSAALNAILLSKQPSLPSILVLYIALTLFVIPAFLFASRRSGGLAIGVSGCIWFSSQAYDLYPSIGKLFPYFNPLAWQFLFSIGMYFGIHYRARAAKVQSSAKPNKWLLIGSWFMVVISLLYRFLPFLARKSHMDLGSLLVYDPFYEHYKYNLSVVRLVHFLSVAFLISVYVDSNAGALRWINDCVIKTGRWSLQIFSLGTVLSVYGTIVFSIQAPTLLEKLLINLDLISLTALAAILMTNMRARSQQLGTPNAR